MSDGSRATAGLRERLTSGTEDKLGKALADLLENPLVTGAIGKAFDARERAAQAQELALGALNIPTAADIERLTRRLRSVSQRLEGIEDGVYRLNRALSEHAVDTRLSAVEDQLKTLSDKLSANASKGASASKEGRVPSTGAAASKGAASKGAAVSKGAASKGAAASKPPSRRSSPAKKS